MTQQPNSTEAAKRFAELSMALLSDQGGIHPYKTKFWKAYLGEAYALWELVRLSSSQKSGWSSEQTCPMGDLAAKLQVAPETITGEIAGRITQPGWIDKLYEEMIVRAEVTERDGAGEILTVKIAVWHDLPFLTPWQAQKLSPELQAEHRAWLDENLRLFRDDGLN